MRAASDINDYLMAVELHGNQWVESLVRRFGAVLVNSASVAYLGIRAAKIEHESDVTSLTTYLEQSWNTNLVEI